MPFCNFDEISLVGHLYQQHLQQDEDGNVLDFLGEKILAVGSLFDNEDIPAGRKIPYNQHPCQVLQIQNGFYHFSKVASVAAKPFVYVETAYSFFMENKFHQEFSSSVFHPPSASRSFVV